MSPQLVSRRRFLRGAAALACWGAAGSVSFSAEARKTRLILLGTKGGPRVSTARSNPSTLLLINDVPYVVDCGYGTTRQLVAAGIPLHRLRYIFITHHHSDHNADYGSLFYHAWVTAQPVQVDAYGPPGLRKMTEDYFSYLKFDIDIRIPDEGRADPRKLVTAHEFDDSGVVLQNDDVEVRACRVRHPPIEHAYAYRFNTKERSIVISGDTAYSPELAEFSTGADVLVHEVMYPPAIDRLVQRLPNATRLREHLYATHTTPEEVGKIAAQAEVKTVVLTHFVPPDDPDVTEEQWASGVREHFKGRIIVGRDLMEI